MHGDVQPHAVGDHRHRVVRLQLRARAVERVARARDVGDHEVQRRRACGRGSVDRRARGARGDRGRDEARRVGQQRRGQRAVALLGARAAPRACAAGARAGRPRRSGSARPSSRSGCRTCRAARRVRTDTGTIATSGSSGSSSRSSSQSRTALAHSVDDDVVDRDAELVLERLDARRASSEPNAKRRCAEIAPVEARLRRARRGRPRARRVASAPGRAAQPRQRAATASARPGTRSRPAGRSRFGSAVGSERSARSGWRGSPSRPRPSISSSLGIALGAARRRALGGDLAALGRRVEQHAEDLVARHAVDHRVVDLGEQRRRGRPRARGSGRAPTAAARGRAGGRRSARPSRRAGGRRPAAAPRVSRTWKSRSKSGSSTQYG